jgi:hypothetical protein
VVSYWREYMSFIKHGDGKIVGIVDPDKLTDDEKKAVKQVTEIVKESDADSSSNKQKKSGS